jgi:hypothetical protein
MSNDTGHFTRRNIVMIPSSGMDKHQVIEAISGVNGWSVKPSEYHDFIVYKGENSIEFKEVRTGVFQSSNIFPQDSKQQHVSIDQDQLTKLVNDIEEQIPDIFMISWMLADKDFIHTKE